jgi:hypothetical protein
MAGGMSGLSAIDAMFYVFLGLMIILGLASPLY